MTSQWDLNEFDSHLRSLDGVITSVDGASSHASQVGGGDPYMYGILVGAVATPIMSWLSNEFVSLVNDLKTANETNRTAIKRTRDLNQLAEQQNTDATQSIVQAINDARSDVERTQR